MLIRIVRMTFDETQVDAFLRIFDGSKNKIRSFRGCRYLELHRDYHQENVFITYSHWDDDDALNRYRKSKLFEEVWDQTKLLFSEPPVAFSNRVVEALE